MHLRMNGIARALIALLGTLALIGCGTNDKGDPLAETPRDVAQEIVSYPVGGVLPNELTWETNNEDPIFASADAKPGGTFRDYVLAFPLTIRRVGPDSNGSFAGYTRAGFLSLVSLHPNTRNFIPTLATHWAFDDDGKTVYYRLHPNAKWSDGTPITADDYLYTLDFMRSKHIVAPWYNNHYATQIVNVVKYDDYTISIEGGSAKPKDEILYEYSMGPVPKHFHVLDQNWVRENNWKVEPNNGPYQISKIEKGKYIEFTRKKDWWGNDLKYYRYRFNPHRIRVRVIRDVNIALQHFFKGELDTFGGVLPEFWHDKFKGKDFDNGYIHKIWFYTDNPQPASGMWLNQSNSILSDRKVRYGLAHAMNIDKVIATVLRGDYRRQHTHHEGYGDYSNTSIRARAFDLTTANTLLDEAGWTERDDRGIRTKGQQTLSLRVTYGQSHHTPRLVILREEAKKAGIDLTLQLLDSSISFKQMLEKKHQIAWMGWSGGGLSPRYRQFYHSDNANKPQNNNLTNNAVPQMDTLIDQYRAATEKTDRVELAHQLEQMLHDTGAVIFTFKVPYTRDAYWRWMKLPEFRGTRVGGLFNPMGGQFWIDELERQSVLDNTAPQTAPVSILDTTYLSE